MQRTRPKLTALCPRSRRCQKPISNTSLRAAVARHPHWAAWRRAAEQEPAEPAEEHRGDELTEHEPREGHLAAAVESHRPIRSPTFRTRPKTNLGYLDKVQRAQGPPRWVHLAAPVRKHTCLFLSRSRLRPRCRGRTRHRNRWSQRVPAFRRRM